MDSSYAASVGRSAAEEDEEYGFPLENEFSAEINELKRLRLKKNTYLYALFVTSVVIVALLSWIFYINNDKVGLMVSTGLMGMIIAFGVAPFFIPRISM